jgi:hypothetical protein
VRIGIRVLQMMSALSALTTAAAWGLESRPAVTDGFEGSELSDHWQTVKFLPGAIRLQSSVVRAGNSAARITLRPGDQIPQEEGTEYERAELRESASLWSVEDAACEYSFSVFLPPDFPITSTRLVIAQWKQRCPFETCTPGNPVLAIRVQSGELLIAKQVASSKQVLYRTTEDMRGRWLDFRFQVRFSRHENGRIRAWLGDDMVVDHDGATAYPEAGGYAGRAVFYFKMGLYRDRMPEPMTLYVDEYSKKWLEDGGV